MPDAGPSEPSAPEQPDASGASLFSSAAPAGSLALWLLLQLGLLGLGVFQIPLSDQYVRPPERLTLEVMVIGEVIFASLLFSFLFQGWTQSTLTVAATWPFIQLAGFLAAKPQGLTVLVTVYVTGWLLILSMWGNVLQSRSIRHFAEAVFSALAILGPVLWYLRAEFGGNVDPSLDSLFGLLGPVMMLLTVARAIPGAAGPWIVLAFALSASLVIWRIDRRRGARDHSN